MKVVQIIDSLKIGGAERMAINIAHCLSENEVDNILVVSRQGGGLENQLSPAVHCEILGKSSFLDFKAFTKLYRLVSNFQPDVVHAHSTSVFWAVAVKLVTGNRFKVVFHDHYGKSESLKITDRRPLRWISRFIDGVIAVNESLKSWSLAVMKLDPWKVIQLNNFPFLPNMMDEVPSSNPVEILHLANFRPQKDHFTLLEALKILSGSCTHDWVISMVGLSESPDYTKIIQENISRLDLTSRIKFFGPSSDVVPFLKRASVGVLSSESEGLSVSLLEYGLAGLHVVATDVGQTKAVLPTEDLGTIVPPKNPQALADALNKAIRESLKGRNNTLREHINLNYGQGQFYKLYHLFLVSL